MFGLTEWLAGLELGLMMGGVVGSWKGKGEVKKGKEVEVSRSANEALLGESRKGCFADWAVSS